MTTPLNSKMAALIRKSLLTYMMMNRLKRLKKDAIERDKQVINEDYSPLSYYSLLYECFLLFVEKNDCGVYQGK